MSIHVLLVEDDDGIRDIVKKFLTKEGYLVDACGDGQTAAEKIYVNHYHIVISRRLCDKTVFDADFSQAGRSPAAPKRRSAEGNNNWQISLTDGILIGLGVSIPASLIPAAKASNLDPIESLRHE